MRNLMAPNIPLALVLLAAVAAVALRAVARRPETPSTGGEIARPPAHPSRPANAVDQAQHIFHELHADGRHSSCAVCDSRYGAA